MILVVNDLSEGANHSDRLASDLQDRYSDVPVFIIQNKSDLLHGPLIRDPYRHWHQASEVVCSTRTGDGLADVKALLIRTAKASSHGLQDVLINARQAALLRQVADHLLAARAAVTTKQPADLIAIDLAAAVRLLGEITGETWNPDILESVFSKFCIGK
jgi:tRNA modification GTPase